MVSTLALLAEGGGRLVLRAAGPTISLGGVGGGCSGIDLKGDSALFGPVEVQVVEVGPVAGVEHVDEAVLDVLMLYISELGLEIILYLLLWVLLFVIFLLLLGIGVISVLEVIGGGELLLAIRHVLLFNLAWNALGGHLDGVVVLGLLWLRGLGVLALGR